MAYHFTWRRNKIKNPLEYYEDLEPGLEYDFARKLNMKKSTKKCTPQRTLFTFEGIIRQATTA